MRSEQMVVVGTGGASATVKPGDVWPIPYRGSKYSVAGKRNSLIVAWRRAPLSIYSEPCPGPLVRAVQEVKGHNGSFKITAQGAIVAKRNTGHRWEPLYVGRYDSELTFPGIDNVGSDLERGMYWLGLPFSHGEQWRVSPYAQGRGRLEWRSLGRVFRSTREYPELINACLEIRPRGGRIYITESGSVWMNAPDAEVSPHHRERLKELQRRQVKQLQSHGRAAILRLLGERIQATGCRPLFVGNISEFDHGEAPWTFFSGEIPVDLQPDY